MKTIDTYTRALLAIKKFEEQNADLFEKYKSLNEAKEQAEEDLKTETKKSGKDQENEFIKVSCVKRYHVWYDVGVFTDTMKKTLLEKGIASIEIDRKRFEKEVALGNIHKTHQADSYREELQSTAVVIKIKSQ